MDGFDTFMGYRRPDGAVGIRNHVAVMPTVSCANGVVGLIAEESPEVVPLYHGHGCSRAGRDLEYHARTLANIGKNPNVAAVLIVGLGCEVIRADYLAARIAASGRPVRFLVIQEEGGSLRTARKGRALAGEMLGEAGGHRRTEAGVDLLTVGLECGGSDAFSGVTANPAVGMVVDWLVERGGTAVLTESTEMIGTTRILERRSCSGEVAGRAREMVEAAERRAREVLGPLASMVIAPGNMDGGMSSIQEKSLGCITKGGSTQIREVIDYGEVPTGKGLVLMDGPGYDAESVSALAAGGCQVILFTTGRGNPLGFPVVPVVKVASNPRLYRSMEDDMDVNAGAVLEGGSLAGVRDDILALLARVCAGEETKAERNRQGGMVCLYTTTASF